MPDLVQTDSSRRDPVHPMKATASSGSSRFRSWNTARALFQCRQVGFLIAAWTQYVFRGSIGKHAGACRRRVRQDSCVGGSAFPVLKAIGIPALVLDGEDDEIVPIRINVDRSFSWYRDLMW